jgi:Ca2+/Na+ antiporter
VCHCLTGYYGIACEEGAAAHTFFTIFEIICLIYLYLGLAVLVDEYLVPAIDCICEKLSLPDQVAGATLVAFGSALPDMLATSIGIATGNSDMGLGGVVGSAVIAFALIPGLCGLVVKAPSPIICYSVVRDSLVFAVALAGLVYFCSDGEIELWEAGTLVGGYVVYLMIVLVPVCCEKKIQKKKVSIAGRQSVSSGVNQVLLHNNAPKASTDATFYGATSDDDTGHIIGEVGGPIDKMPDSIKLNKQLSLIAEENDDSTSVPSSTTSVKSLKLDETKISIAIGGPNNHKIRSNSEGKPIQRPTSQLPQLPQLPSIDQTKFQTDPGPEWLTGGFRYQKINGVRFQKPGLAGETPVVIGYNFSEYSNRIRSMTHHQLSPSTIQRLRNRSKPARSWGRLYKWERTQRARSRSSKQTILADDALAEAAKVKLDNVKNKHAELDEVEDGKLMSVFKIIWWPFYFLFKWTIPDPHQCPKLYIISFVISLLYLSGISYTGFTITEDIAQNIFFDPVLAGETMIAIGTSVPDILSSVSWHD